MSRQIDNERVNQLFITNVYLPQATMPVFTVILSRLILGESQTNEVSSVHTVLLTMIFNVLINNTLNSLILPQQSVGSHIRDPLREENTYFEGKMKIN